MFLSRKLKFTELNITDIQDIPSLCTDFKYKFQKEENLFSWCCDNLSFVWKLLCEVVILVTL